MFTGCIMEGETIVFAPLGADLGFDIGEDNSTLMSNRMNVTTGRTGPSDVDDLDDV